MHVDFAAPGQADVNPPTVTITAPSAGTLTRTNPTVTGQAVDDSSGVASLQAKLDGGAPFPVTFDNNGKFSFVTSLLTNGSADGKHTVAVQATDRAGITRVLSRHPSPWTRALHRPDFAPATQ